MRKVLVDPAALEEAAKWLEIHSSSSGSAEAFAADALRKAIAQPAEAEGVVPVICYLRATPDGTPEWSEDCVCEDAVYPNYDGDETVSMPLVSQSDHLAALSAVTAERDRLANAFGDCISSLHAEMLQKYGGQLPEDMHPVTRRDYVRDMEEIAEYRAAMAAKEAEPEHVCSGCGAKGWTGNCLECIPY